MAWDRIVVIAIGGALGALCRYGMGTFIASWLGSSVLGTFTVNISGALALGLVVGLMESRWDAPALAAPAIGIGFLGAYTTFSTLMFESVDLAGSRSAALAVLNIAGSVSLGLLAAYSGLFIGRHA
jgi:CrcB protein